MDRPGTQMWTWTLCVLLTWMCGALAAPGPHYMVAIPAVLEAGAETHISASLMEPNETLVMTVTLRSEQKNLTLVKETSSVEFHNSFKFQVPSGLNNDDVAHLEVEVRGATFYSKEVRKVMIKTYAPMTFVQTDKPIYLPGQTVNFRVVTIDTKFRPATRLYDAIHIEVDEAGCATFVFEMSTFTKIAHKVAQDSLLLKAKVEEEGTGITHQQEMMMRISMVIGKLIFIDTPKIFEMGSDVAGKIKAVHHNDTPISNMKVYLFEGDIWSAKQIQELTTDGDGVAAFNYSTAESKSEIHLRAGDKPELRQPYIVYEEGYFKLGYHMLTMAQDASLDSKTVSSLEVQKKEEPIPCDTEEDISVKYTIVGETQGSATLIYVVLARGALVTQGSGQIEVQDQTVTEGEMSFKFRVSPEMSPDVQVVAYAVLPSETVIAHSADFSTEKCFSHKVSLEFSPSLAVPGEENTLQLTAQPDSLCGVSAVDQSVLVKEPEKTLDNNRIFDLLPITKASYIPYEIEDPQECLVVRPKRYILPSADETDDPYTVFKNVGLKMATNLDIRVPSCLKYGERQYTHSETGFGVAYNSMMETGGHGGGGGGGGGSPPPIETVRTFFPETWIWDLVEIGESGTKKVTLTVPDTITTWETEVFCLSPQGLGLAPREKLTVFQPFFLQLSLPYSIIRGENFELKATVFNYLSSCIMVTVTPAPSLDYTLVPKPGDEYTTCLCGNERKTFSWTLTPSALGDVTVSATAEAVASHISCNNEIVIVPERGRSDTVSRTLKVKAEGIEKTKASNLLLCPKDEVLTEKVEIQLPENEIDGSGRSLVSVLGDIMGRALNNLDGQLQMPYGCGEQNMALLAPNIYILQYLEDTKQLTPDIKTKGTSYLTSGYQRQLNYKHHDGAFSTFGSGSGNTWLTAFVMRSFVKAQNFIFIDQTVINDAKTWLIDRQKGSGCFEQLGKLFNNNIKGGVSDKVTITAYVTAAFLEMNHTVTDSITKSLSCLKKSISNVRNTYAVALQAYIFTLAGDMDTRATLLRHLDSVAIKEGGFTHWDQTAADTSLSISVEMTSYVLLAILSVPPPVEELGYATGIVRWLTSQQNYYGGFSSTQDTVVALQALALYSTLVFSPEGSSSVKVKSSSGELDFEVNKDNKLLYQEQLLKDLTGKYTVEVKGSACASVQISHHYNIPATPIESTLDVEVSTKAECSNSSTRPKMTLTLKSVYSGKRPTTNMVILDIKMLSGFVPDQESLKELKDETQVELVEHKDDHVLVYIKELSVNTPVQFDLELIQELIVSDLKPSVVKIYDYYQPSKPDLLCTRHHYLLRPLTLRNPAPFRAVIKIRPITSTLVWQLRRISYCKCEKWRNARKRFLVALIGVK
ncbi:alpha-2-macroglobulin-like [Tautogolabrus adspersus]